MIERFDNDCCQETQIARALPMLKRAGVWIGLGVLLAVLSLFVAAKQPQESKNIAVAVHQPQTEAPGAGQESKKDAHRQGAKAEAHTVDPSQYVGSDTCATCHEEQAKSVDKGPHWKTNL